MNEIELLRKEIESLKDQLNRERDLNSRLLLDRLRLGKILKRIIDDAPMEKL